MNQLKKRLMFLLLVGEKTTHELAVKVGGLQPNHISFNLIQCRAEGLVEGAKRGNTFYWWITNAGRELLEEGQEKYILWSPQGTINPKKVHNSLREAEDARKEMVERHVGNVFYILPLGKGLVKKRVERIVVEEQLVEVD